MNPLTEIPTTEPAQLIIGDTLQWKRVDLGSDFPNSAYTAKFYARSFGTANNTFNITATNSGSDYLFTKAAASTAGLIAGLYSWQLKITRTSDSAVVTVDEGTIEIISSRSVNADPRSHARIMLDKIESILQGRADSDVSSYSIQGRSISKMAPSELEQWRARYKAEIANEKAKENAANGKGTGRIVLYRFT